MSDREREHSRAGSTVSSPSNVERRRQPCKYGDRLEHKDNGAFVRCRGSAADSSQRPVRDEPLLAKGADGGDPLVVAVVVDEIHVGLLGRGCEQ